MNLFLKTSTLLKTGLAVAAVAVAAVNFSQTNANTERVLTVSDANALDCLSAANKLCTGYTSDGLYHEATNSENIQ
jgi:uncharacterized membrane protein